MSATIIFDKNSFLVGVCGLLLKFIDTLRMLILINIYVHNNFILRFHTKVEIRTAINLNVVCVINLLIELFRFFLNS